MRLPDNIVDIGKPLAHIFDLADLGMVDVSLARDLLTTWSSVRKSRLVIFPSRAQIVFRLG